MSEDSRHSLIYYFTNFIQAYVHSTLPIPLTHISSSVCMTFEHSSS